MSLISTQEQGYDEQSFHAFHLSAHLKAVIVVVQESGQIRTIDSMFKSSHFFLLESQLILGWVFMDSGSLRHKRFQGSGRCVRDGATPRHCNKSLAAAQQQRRAEGHFQR